LDMKCEGRGRARMKYEMQRTRTSVDEKRKLRVNPR
jgi:hypothetical protein